MKSDITLMILMGLPILIFARPDLYKESEDFKYSRSSDGASKSGFYESQRGNMGGNFEKAYNMDNLAHRQLSDIATGVGGQTATNLRAGSTFGSASTSGTEYGAVKNAGVGTSSGLGASTSLGLNGISDSNYGATSGSNYNQEYAQSSDLHRYTTFDRNAANAASLQSEGRYNLHGGTASNLALEQGSLQHHATGGQNGYHGGARGQTYYDASSGQYIQQRSRGQTAYDATSSQTVQGNSHLSSLNRPLAVGQTTQESSQLSSYNRPLVVTPVRIQIVPGRVVTVPVTAQASNLQSSVNQYSSAQTHNQASTNINGEYDTPLYGNAQDYNAINTQLPTKVNNGGANNYQSSYNYRKQWERHGTPVATNVAPQVTIPVVVPVETIPESSGLLQTEDTGLSNQRTQGSLRYNSGSRVASTSGQRYGATQYSNTNAYAGQANSQHEDTLSSASNINQASNINSQSLLTDDRHLNSELDQLATSNQGRPKAYQSSYSYHKSWERHGTPYVIKPISAVDGSVDLNADHDLDAAAQTLQNQQSHQSASSAYTKNSYRSSSSSGLSGASNGRYQQGNLCDINCYLKESGNNLESGSYRNKRSYNAHYANKQHSYPNSDSEEDYGLGQQQLQQFNNKDVDDWGQQVAEDFGQQIEQSITNGQQTENFGQIEKNEKNQHEENLDQAAIPEEPIDGKLFHVYETNLNNKPDQQYSFLFPKPSININSAEETTTKKQINTYHNHNSHGHRHGWSQQHFSVDEDPFVHVQNQNQFSIHHPNMDSYFEMMNKQFEESLRNPNLYQSRLGFNFQHPVNHYPPNYEETPHYLSFNNDFGHDRNIYNEHLFLHKHSQLDKDCDKDITVTTVRSMDEEDVLKRINELQKELGLGLFDLNKPEIPQTHSQLPHTTEAIQTNIISVPREKTPEEIEALSLTRNSSTPKKSTENDEHPDVNLLHLSNTQNNFNSHINNQNKLGNVQNPTITLYTDTHLVGKLDHQRNENTYSKQNIDNVQKYSNLQNIGKVERNSNEQLEDQDFGQQIEDIGQQTQDFSQQIEDLGQQTQDFGQQTHDFGQSIEHTIPKSYNFNKQDNLDQNVNKEMESRDQKLNSLHKNQENIDQQVENNIGFQLGIVKQQIQEQKNDPQEETNMNFNLQGKLYENQRNKEMASLSGPHSTYNAIIVENQHKETQDENSGEELEDAGQVSLNIGSNLLDIRQSKDFDQSQINAGHQIQLTEEMQAQDLEETQLHLDQQVQIADQSLYENIQLKSHANEGVLEPDYSVDGQINLQITPPEQIKQDVVNDQKYKNLEIDESSVALEQTTIKPGFFKNMGNKLKNIFG